MVELVDLSMLNRRLTVLIFNQRF